MGSRLIIPNPLCVHSALMMLTGAAREVLFCCWDHFAVEPARWDFGTTRGFWTYRDERIIRSRSKGSSKGRSDSTLIWSRFCHDFACRLLPAPLGDLGANQLGLLGRELEGAPGSTLVVLASPMSAHDAGGRMSVGH